MDVELGFLEDPEDLDLIQKLSNFSICLQRGPPCSTHSPAHSVEGMWGVLGGTSPCCRPRRCVAGILAGLSVRL